MATKIIAGLLLIVALAAAGTVGVAYFSDYSISDPPASPPAVHSQPCYLNDPASCSSEPKPCCALPAREEIFRCGGVIGDKAPPANTNGGD